MNDTVTLCLVGFFWLVADFLLFTLEYRKLERQHKRHKEEIEKIVSNECVICCNYLYYDLIHYFEGRENDRD